MREKSITRRPGLVPADAKSQQIGIAFPTGLKDY
jgi:hypothetical protein